MMALNFWLKKGKEAIRVFPFVNWEKKQVLFRIIVGKTICKEWNLEMVPDDCGFIPLYTFRAEFDLINQILKTRIRDERILRILKQIAFLFADDDEKTIKLLRR